MAEDNPEVSLSIDADGIRTNYHDIGNGDSVVLLIHGSGPGVSAWANWRLTLPALAERYRVIAPDMVGFGFTERPPGHEYTMTNWIKHVVAFMNALRIDKFSVVGNSFGGALALGLTIQHSERVDKLVLMGAVGTSFKITEGLDKVWGYRPSIANMKELMDIFAWNRELVTDELAESRYRASIQPGFPESYAAMFPPPRQRWVDAMAFTDDQIRSVSCPTLICHGREDQIIPLDTSQRFFSLIPQSELHLFGQCGHWTQIEYAEIFNKMLSDFIARS